MQQQKEGRRPPPIQLNIQQLEKKYVQAVKGSLLLASSVAFKDTREKGGKLSCIIPCHTDSYLLLGTAQLAVAAVSVAKRCCSGLCFCPSRLAKGAVEQRLCDPGCAGPREFPFTEGKVTFSSVSPGLCRWWFGGFWWGFFKLTVKIGQCRKRLLCQLLRNYFWIPKLSEFSKSS